VGQYGSFLIIAKVVMYFIGQNVNITEAEHVHHEEEPLFDCLFVKILDLDLLDVTVKLADLLDGKLAVIGVCEQFSALTNNLNCYPKGFVCSCRFIRL